MVNRKEFISRIFRKETIVDTIKSVKPVFSLVLPESEDFTESNDIHVPELTGDMVYFEAMRLGIDPSNFTIEELRQKILNELSAVPD